MKIKTITYHSALNYGAVLQAYALQRYLKDGGNEVSVIDYRSRKGEKAYRILKPPHSGKDVIKLIYNIIRYKELRLRKKRFEAFITKYMALTRRYTCLEDFERYGIDGDVFIAGSDQVWNCNGGINREFFLDFDIKNASRVSYGASIGVPSIPKAYIDEVGKLLGKFDRVSVRENEAKDLLFNEYGIKSEVVCDPVVLLEKEQWGELIPGQPPVTGDYILCYSLLSNNEVQRCIDQIKEKYKMPVYIIAGNGYIGLKGDKIIRNAGPIEFLNLINHAKFVICCSFHGTVFSSLLNKEFISVIDRNKPSRVTEYLTEIGLADRIYQDTADLSLSAIDYETVNTRIEALRSTGIDFLKTLSSQKKEDA